MSVTDENQWATGQLHVQNGCRTGVSVCLCDSGNMASLKHCPQSSKIDIYKTLQQFRLKYYLPQYMTLVVQSQGSCSLMLLLLLLLLQNRTFEIITSPPVGMRSIAMSMCVFLSVCLSVCLFACISQKPPIQSSRNFLYVLSEAMVESFLWWQCNTLCTSSCTRAMQPVATCRQSPYLHKPAVIMMTSFLLWRHLLLSWPRPALQTTNIRTPYCV